MTTIRCTRRPRRPSDGDHGGDAVRLVLVEPPAERSRVDGAWWPRTRSLGHELPALIEELRRRGIRVTRAGYHPGGWDAAPRRLEADRRVIRLGWSRSIDPQLLELTGGAQRGRLDLLVVPPDTTAAAAEQAFSTTTGRADEQPPSALAGGLSPVVAPVPRPPTARVGVEETAVRDSEGGGRLLR